MNNRWIIMFGNITEGFRFVGTFQNPGDAIVWAEQNTTYEWWVVMIENPQEAES